MKSYTFCGRTTQQTFLLKTQRSSHLLTGWRQRILEANEAPWDCNKQHWGHWGCTNTLNKIQERKKKLRTGTWLSLEWHTNSSNKSKLQIPPCFLLAPEWYVRIQPWSQLSQDLSYNNTYSVILMSYFLPQGPQGLTTHFSQYISTNWYWHCVLSMLMSHTIKELDR